MFRQYVWFPLRKKSWWFECRLRKAFRPSVQMRTFQIMRWLLLVGLFGSALTILGVYLDTPAPVPSAPAAIADAINWSKVLVTLVNNLASGLFSAFVAVVTIEALQERALRAATRTGILKAIRSDAARDNTLAIEELTISGWLQSYVLCGTKISNANFRNQDLQGAVFAFCDLAGTYFDGSNLSGADLRCAILRDASFEKALLVDCDLRGADLVRVDRDALIQAGARLDNGRS